MNNLIEKVIHKCFDVCYDDNRRRGHQRGYVACFIIIAGVLYAPIIMEKNVWLQRMTCGMEMENIMEFRPCIDIHNGKVKQIVGQSLRDAGSMAEENFVACEDAAFFAKLYKKDGQKGGHVILLNPKDSPYYEKTKAQALLALKAYPGGLQVGGGITDGNAQEFLDAGASHVIVTSYVFREGKIHYDNLKKISAKVGKEHLVLDISCRKRDGAYYIVTDRWQKFTGEKVCEALLEQLCGFCDEFLIHAVDVEGKANGIEEELVSFLGNWEGIPITYAGGVGSFADLEKLRKLGKDKLNVTIGSALDLFGGPMAYDKVLQYMKRSEQ